jgi:hypothetical protein
MQEDSNCYQHDQKCDILACNGTVKSIIPKNTSHNMCRACGTFGRLWSCFYDLDAPLDLYTDLEDYMNGSWDFAHIDVYKFALLFHAEKEVCS